MGSELHIVEYDEIAEKLDEVKEYSDFLPDVTTKEGYEKSKRVSLDIGKLKTALEKKRKEKKQYFLDGGKAVDSKAEAIAAKLDEMQLPHLTAYKELDKAKKEREQKRKEQLEERVRYIRELPDSMRDSSSNEIKLAIESMHNEQCTDFFEYTEQALKARNTTRDKLAELFAKTLKAEKDAEELEQLRKAQAEQQRKEHEERIARKAEERARLQAEQEAAERERKIKAEQERKERQAREAIERAEREKQEAIERERQAKLQAEEAARLAAEQERQRIEQERLEAEEMARKKAENKRHRGKINREALADIINLGFSEADGKKLIEAVAKGQVKNVSINY